MEAEDLRPDDVAPPASRTSAASPAWGLLLGVGGVVVLADQASKLWAYRALSGLLVSGAAPSRKTVVAGYFDLCFAQNPGGAWSFLRSLPDGLRRPFFLVVASVASVVIVSTYSHLRPEQRAVRWGLALALGGALGNLVDRVRFGWVIDFLDLYVVRGGQPHHWPTFNVADIAICVGVGLLCWDLLGTARREGAAGTSA